MSRLLPLILDVDTGIDDALALAFAVGSPDADVVAVTTVAGNVDIEQATANTLNVLDWLGAVQVPVHRGASRPLVRPHRDATHFHDQNGIGGAELPTSTRAPGADRGPAAIIRLASASPGSLTLVCLGPLTNLAIALNVEPRLPSLLRAVVVMGGAFRGPGNVSPTAEYNVYADPEAAAQVFAAPFPKLTVVGLEVTQQAVWTRTNWLAAAEDQPREPATTLAIEVCRRIFTERGFTGFYLHDPLAVGVALDPSLVRTEAAAVMVGLSTEDRGVTRVIGPGTVQIAQAVDAEQFVTAFVRTLRLPMTAHPPVGEFPIATDCAMD